jgi:hypothetical protein
MANVRERFAAGLDSRIDLIEQALPHVTRSQLGTEAVAAAHLQVHDMCGLAATVGFPQTGLAARSIERILLDARRDKRGLTAEEALRLKTAVQRLRRAAAAELPDVVTRA